MSAGNSEISASPPKRKRKLTISNTSLMASADQNRFNRVEILLHLLLRLVEDLALNLLAFAEVFEQLGDVRERVGEKLGILPLQRRRSVQSPRRSIGEVERTTPLKAARQNKLAKSAQAREKEGGDARLRSSCELRSRYCSVWMRFFSASARCASTVSM